MISALAYVSMIKSGENSRTIENSIHYYSVIFFLATKESPQRRTNRCALLFCVLRRGARGCPPSKQDVWHSIHTYSPLFNCYIYKGLSRRRTHGGSSAPGLENSVVFGHRYWTDVPFFSPFFPFSACKSILAVRLLLFAQLGDKKQR